MSDFPGPEYYERIRRLRQTVSAKRGQHTAVHRLHAALVPKADQLLAETGHASFLADSRAVANELLARHLSVPLGAPPDALTLFLAIAEALHEALTGQARALADRALPAKAPGTGTMDTARGAATASTILDVRYNPHAFLAQAARFHLLRANKPQEARIWLLRRFAGRTPAEVAHLLGREERAVEDCLALFEQFDLAPQAN